MGNGEGGFGAVFEGTHHKDGLQVAAIRSEDGEHAIHQSCK